MTDRLNFDTEYELLFQENLAIDNNINIHVMYNKFLVSFRFL